MLAFLGTFAYDWGVREDDRMLTVKEIQERLKVSDKTVRRWLQSGELRGVRLGGTKLGWRVSAYDLRRFVRERQNR